MMVLMLILHVFRVYLTGGFKRPRELTWVTGVTMAVITVSFGVTGYSLPWDQVGYWAVKIVSGVPAAIPVVGDAMAGAISFACSNAAPTGSPVLTSSRRRSPAGISTMMSARCAGASLIVCRSNGSQGAPSSATTRIGLSAPRRKANTRAFAALITRSLTVPDATLMTGSVSPFTVSQLPRRP